MRALADRVVRTIQRHRLAQPADRIAIALSGGPDSVALTWLLHDLEQRGAAAPIAGLIHVNHLLRGADADLDEIFCRSLADRLGVPCEVQRVDVGDQARACGRSIEAVAHDARYAFFEEAAGRLGATLVATGHTLDDQAETVLMRVLRGAGSRGLSGIRPRLGRIIRPLLDCRKADLRRYLQERGEAFREDLSNVDVSIARNRVRHEVLPVVLRVAPGADRALARLARLAAEDEAWLTGAAIENRAAVVLSDKGRVRELDAVELGTLPPALSRRLVRELAAEVRPAAALSAQHLEAVVDLAASDGPDGWLDLPGLGVRRTGRTLVIGAARPGRRAASSAGRPSGWQAWPERRLDVPGEVELGEIDAVIVASEGAAADSSHARDDATVRATVQAASLKLPLTVRNRRPGDRFRPFGAPGRRKLQDVLVDRKVPRAQRDAVPVIVDAEGRIVWVAGVAVAEGCRVSAPEAGVVILEMRKGQ